MSRDHYKKNFGKKSRTSNSTNHNRSKETSEMVKILELGHHGDGIAKSQDGKNCFVPYTLPGETAEIRHSENSCSLVEIHKASEDRIKLNSIF